MLAGSSILMAGVGLIDADYFVDDLPATITDLSSWDEYNWDLIRLQVPDGASDGVLKIVNGDASATLSRLHPWWTEGNMPTALGTPTFDDLPSINEQRSFQFEVNGTPDDFRIMNFTNRLLQRQDSFSVTDLTVVDDQTILVDYVANRFGSTFVFRDATETLWNIIPVLPTPPALIEVPTIQHSTDVEFIAFDVDEPETMDHVTVTWGSHSWATDRDRTHLVYEGSRFSSPHFEHSFQSPLYKSHYEGIDLGDNPAPNLAFSQFSFDVLPEAPLQVANHWGSLQTEAVDDSTQAALTQFASQLVAQQGTAADPTLPSVNPGQIIELPEEIADVFSAAYFSTPATDDDPQWFGSLV